MKNSHGGTIYRTARQLGINPKKILDFSANINPKGFSHRIRKVLFDNTAILNYPDQEAYDLIHELSLYHELPGENILAGNGSTEFIFLLPRMLKPRSVLLVIPTFTEYETSIRRTGGEIFYFKTLEKENYHINKRRLLKELQKDYDALYICNPGNPTGTLTTADELHEIVFYAKRRQITVIIDETFIDFQEGQSLKHEVRRFKNLYILRSMTKFFALPGLRAGYIFSHRENIKKLISMQEPWTMNALAQLASIESLRDHSFIKKSIQYVGSARNDLIFELKKIPCLKVFASAANYLLLKLRESSPVTVDELFARLLNQKILIRKCGNFQGMGDVFIRIAVKKRNENRRLLAELEKILEAGETVTR